MQTKKLRKTAACFMAGILFSFSAAYAAPLELTLEDAVKMTLETNPTGKMAVYDFESSKGALTAARSYRWPTVSGTDIYARTWSGERSRG